VKLSSKDGIEMMDIRSLERAGDVLIIKGKIMRSMPATIHLRPEDLWEGVKLCSGPLLLRLPLLLFKGFRQSRRARRAAPTSQ
jgi:hypothetical protein